MVRKYRGRKNFSLTLLAGSLILIFGVGFMVRDTIELEIGDLAYNATGKLTSVISRGDANFWYNLAAENGNLEAQAKLGSILTNPKNSESSIQEGLKWLKRSADSGDTEAMFTLGKIYQEGNITKQDKALAIKYFIASTKSPETLRLHPNINSKIASLYYSICLEESKCSDNNDNLKQAIFWAEKGVASNEISSAETLTDIYLTNKTNIPEIDALRKAYEFNVKAINLGSHTNGMAVLIALKLYALTNDKQYIKDYNKYFPAAYVDTSDKNRTLLENAPVMK